MRNNVVAIVRKDIEESYVDLYEVPEGLIEKGEEAVLELFRTISRSWKCTEAGSRLSKLNDGHLSWNDFANIPMSHLVKYGVREIMYSAGNLICVNANEDMIAESPEKGGAYGSKDLSE